MLVGLGVSDVRRLAVDWKFTVFAFASSSCCVAAIGLFIVCDVRLLHLFAPATHQVLLFLSTVPMAATTVVYATELRIEPQKTAVTVLLARL